MDVRDSLRFDDSSLNHAATEGVESQHDAMAGMSIHSVGENLDRAERRPQRLHRAGGMFC